MTEDLWDQFIEGPRGRFVESFRQNYETRKGLPYLYNLGIALMDSNQFEEARDVFARLAGLEADSNLVSDATLIRLGTAEWFLGNPGKAISNWLKSLEADYGDEAGGIGAAACVWYAGIRTGDKKLIAKSEKALRRLSKRRLPASRDCWPGPIAIAEFLLDEIQPDSLLVMKARDQTLESRRLCRVNFWMGIRSNKPQLAQAMFLRACQSRVAILEDEYFLASWEVQNGKKQGSQ